MRLNKTTKVMGIVGLVMVFFLFLELKQFFDIQGKLTKENLRMQDVRDKLKRLKIYGKDKMEKEFLSLDCCFLPQGKSSEIIERMTRLGKERQLSLIDISPRFFDLREDEWQGLPFSRRLKLLSIEIAWAGSYVQIANYLEAVTEIQDTPLFINSLEIKRDTLIKDRLRMHIVLYAYVLG